MTMWKFEQIQAKNLCAFKDLNYSIQHNKTTLIFGNNLDNDSQGSNGSGKSALIEAIAIALTGAPLRKVSVDEIINDSEDEAIIAALLINDVLEERITVCRTLSRKQPQSIQVLKHTGESTEEIVQSSVADYNKYILDLIGLSKEDIYSNFILSKHKYTSFLSSSDKDKKEIINRFSNGILVDESLAALQADMAPVQEELKVAEGHVSMASGKVSAINEQIATETVEATEKSQNKAKRIADLKEKIAAKREYIREQNKLKCKADNRWNILEAIDGQLQSCEKSSKTLSAAQLFINKLFKENELEGLGDFVSGIEAWNVQLADLAQDSQQLGEELKAKETKLKELEEESDDIKSKSDAFKIKSASIFESLAAKIDELQASIELTQENREALQFKIRTAECVIASLSNQLAGIIACPKCKHEFVLNNSIDINETRKQLKERKDTLSSLQKSFDDATQQIDDFREAVYTRPSRMSFSTFTTLPSTTISIPVGASFLKWSIDKVLAGTALSKWK